MTSVVLQCVVDVICHRLSGQSAETFNISAWSGDGVAYEYDVTQGIFSEDPYGPGPGDDDDYYYHSDGLGDAYVIYCTGTCDGSDAVVQSTPGTVVMGGGVDVDEAMAWMITNANGGDFVVLRASGSDGYNVSTFSIDNRFYMSEYCVVM